MRTTGSFLPLLSSVSWRKFFIPLPLPLLRPRMSSGVPEIKVSKIEVKKLNDPKEIKKLFDSLSEFGVEYEYESKKNRIIIRGEIDWCDDEFIGIDSNDVEIGISVFKKYTVIRLRQRIGEDIKIKDVRILRPTKFHYFHSDRKLILDLNYEVEE